MGISIFDVDPDARPNTFSDDVVGRFRGGTQVNGRPLALEAWRITTGDPDVASAVVDLFGGDEPQKWETQTEEDLEVFTDAEKVRVILDGPSAVRSNMVLWGRNGIIHTCDGQVTTEGDPCPQAGLTVKERKEAAKAGHGCEPSIQAYFRLAEDPDLGKFKFFSGSWTLAADVDGIEAALEKIDGPALMDLFLRVVEFTTRTGRDVRYVRPVMKVVGPAPESSDSGDEDAPF